MWRVSYLNSHLSWQQNLSHRALLGQIAVSGSQEKAAEAVRVVIACLVEAAGFDRTTAIAWVWAAEAAVAKIVESVEWGMQKVVVWVSLEPGA